MDDKDLFPFGNDLPENTKLYAHRTYSVVRFDSRVVSLQASTYDYTGGAHEALGETSLNWDLQKSKPIALDDLFARGKDWNKFVTDYCMKDLHDQLSGEPDPDRSPWRAVADRGTGSCKATLPQHFTVYAVASSPRRNWREIPYETLRPHRSRTHPFPEIRFAIASTVPSGKAVLGSLER
jgi:hypothetical protein